MKALRHAAYRVTLAVVTILSSVAQAGEWGTGLWGQMYWGSNHESAPIVAPNVSVTADGTDLTIALNNLLTGGEVGWTAITHFLVACDGLQPVEISVDNPTLTNLEPDTTYNCSIIAVNRLGQSPASIFVATTDSLGTIPIWLLYQATQPS